MLNHGTRYNTNSLFYSSYEDIRYYQLLDIINYYQLRDIINSITAMRLQLAKEITHYFYRTNFVRTKRLNFVKQIRPNEEYFQGEKLNTENCNNNNLLLHLLFFQFIFFYNSFCLHKRNWNIHITSIQLFIFEAIIIHQKLCLTCSELRSSCMGCKSYRELLTLESITRQNGQVHFKNLAAFAARFIKCV